MLGSFKACWPKFQQVKEPSAGLPFLFHFFSYYNYCQMHHLQEFVRQEALHMLENALEGSGGSAASSAYTESFRIIMRFAVGDKSFVVRIAAARCLKAFAIIGGPGLGVGDLENSASYCVKAGFFFITFCLPSFQSSTYKNMLSLSYVRISCFYFLLMIATGP